MKKLSLAVLVTLTLGGCDSSSTSGVTSSSAVGGDFNTMSECKNSIDNTAKKYNVSYTVEFDDRDYFSGKVVKDGVQTDLLIACNKTGDYFSATFEIPN